MSQGVCVVFATQTFSSRSSVEFWHINVIQISLAFISSNNTGMSNSQAHELITLTSYREAVDLIKHLQLFSSIYDNHCQETGQTYLDVLWNKVILSNGDIYVLMEIDIKS